jgi:GNAT superfamily N-acetyltransferase
MSEELVEKWLRGWSLSRNLPLPERYRSGFKVEVGEEKQKIRYVFPELNDDFIQLAESVTEPWIYLKVCASPEQLKGLVPERWIFQPEGYMMHCRHPMIIPDIALTGNYSVDIQCITPEYFTVRILCNATEQAAIGRLIIIDDVAVYDRVVTEEEHRRKGLASIVLAKLEEIALSKGVSNNFLVATQQGKLLYESLGWKLYSSYTSIVIPDRR